MAESPGEASPATAAPEERAAEAFQAKKITVRELLEAGVHFGHQTRRWNPMMKRFIYGERNGIHIIDLDQTVRRFRAAMEAVKSVTANGGKVLFVGTKRQAQAPIQLEAERAGQYYVSRRWLGGMLTNFRTVKKSIEDFKNKLGVLDDEERVAEHSKKELARLNRMIARYRKSLDGIKEMTRLPDMMFVVDVSREHIAVSEAQRLGIPVVAVVDSNCSPRDIDYVIPGNDDATRAVALYCARVADACIEGDRIHQERLRAQPRPEDRPAEEKAAPASGRVVVEITQPPRRGRGVASRRGVGGTVTAGGRRDEEAEKPAERPVEKPAEASAETTGEGPAAEPAASDGETKKSDE